MKRYSRGFLRIAFFIVRPTKIVMDWFRGTMLYTRHNTKWFVRIFELGNGINEALLDFGSLRPDGIITCGAPVRFIRDFFAARGMGDVPIMAFPQQPYFGVGSVTLDFDEIAKRAMELFKRRGCRHVVYVGTHLTNGIRLSRALARAFVKAAEAAGLTYSIPPRKTYSSIGIRVAECDEAMRQLKKFPKPCGILTYDDGIGRDMLDLCRLCDIAVPGSVYMLGMDDDELVCENSYPTLSSIQLDYVETAYEAAQALDNMIRKRTKKLPRLVCGVRGITERSSTQDPKGVGRLVTLAREYIAENACRRGGLNQHDIAKHFGVSIRTLQLRFKESRATDSILSEIRRVQLKNVCRLLTTTDKAIEDITYDSGFKSLSRLKSIFQAKFGMSMRDYRNSIKNGHPPPHYL